MGKSKIFILGGGITGLVVQRFLPRAVILEGKKKTESQNRTFDHGTNYLWEDLPGFKTFPVVIETTVDEHAPDEENICRYKIKIGKSCADRKDWPLQFAPVQKGFLIDQYPEPTKIRYNLRVEHLDLRLKRMRLSNGLLCTYDTLVSTIPLFNLVQLTELNKAYPVQTLLKFAPIYVTTEPIKHFEDPALIRVNYISNPNLQPYRYCDRLGQRHYESLTPYRNPQKKIFPGKIWPHPAVPEILNRLKLAGIYCFGRFATWNPEELVHETYKEIEQWTKTI